MNQSSILIERLKLIYKDKAINYAQGFDSTLAELVAQCGGKVNDANLITSLINLFDDKAEYPEIMDSIVHIIEDADRVIYFQSIANSLPMFWIKSPYWAKDIHVRILNSPDDAKDYLRFLQTLEQSKKQIIRDIVVEISNELPQMKGKAENFIAKIA
jgi:hypothetical protein